MPSMPPYGNASPKASAQFEKSRHRLRHEPGGVREPSFARWCICARSIRTESALLRCWGYFRGHRHRMRYAEAKAQRLPIGSGVVEAACKTLVAERLKRSGMRWGHCGGQAILTLRALVQRRALRCGLVTALTIVSCAGVLSSQCRATTHQKNSLKLISLRGTPVRGADEPGTHADMSLKGAGQWLRVVHESAWRDATEQRSKPSGPPCG